MRLRGSSIGGEDNMFALVSPLISGEILARLKIWTLLCRYTRRNICLARRASLGVFGVGA